jgi:hypothetical protein
MRAPSQAATGWTLQSQSSIEAVGRIQEFSRRTINLCIRNPSGRGRDITFPFADLTRTSIHKFEGLAPQEAGLIRYSRDRITVLNRAGLEKRTCECYAVVKREYDRLLPDQEAH